MEKNEKLLCLNRCSLCKKIPSINILYEEEKLKISYNCSCKSQDNIKIEEQNVETKEFNEIKKEIDIDEEVEKIQDTYTKIIESNARILKSIKEYHEKNNEVILLKDIIKNINSSKKYKNIEDKLNTLQKVLDYENKILKLFKNYKLSNEYPIITKDGIKNEIFINELDESDYYYNLNLDSDEAHLKEDAVKKPAYDNNDNTLFQYKGGNLSYTYILIDKNAIGKTINFKVSDGYKWLVFYNEENKLNSCDFRTNTYSIKIPQNATKMCFYCNEGAGCYQMSITN